MYVRKNDKLKKDYGFYIWIGAAIVALGLIIFSKLWNFNNPYVLYELLYDISLAVFTGIMVFLITSYFISNLQKEKIAENAYEDLFSIAFGPADRLIHYLKNVVEHENPYDLPYGGFDDEDILTDSELDDIELELEEIGKTKIENVEAEITKLLRGITKGNKSECNRLLHTLSPDSVPYLFVTKLLDTSAARYLSWSDDPQHISDAYFGFSDVQEYFEIIRPLRQYMIEKYRLIKITNQNIEEALAEHERQEAAKEVKKKAKGNTGFPSDSDLPF